jgi:nickel-dependent lactate racemase
VLFEALDAAGPAKRVLAIPPDGTRSRARAGLVLKLLKEYCGSALTDVLPALGTHAPMSRAEIAEHFPGIPPELFRAHDWRKDLVTLGEVPASYVRELSEGKLEYAWPAQVNKLLVEGGYDLIVSIGQVVPHEVVGMANHVKNVFVGTGGSQGIHRSHYLGAVYGMERIMGRTDSPVRALFDYASKEFASSLPLLYALTVVGDPVPGEEAKSDRLRGIFVGDDRACFEKAAELSRSLNVHLVDRAVSKAVVFLPPDEFRSTWLGNKSIYRTRMALADGAELLVIAPGVARFGEDDRIDALIRRWGYRGTEATLAAVAADPELGASLSAAAHLIHGSSDSRFAVTYCPGKLSRQEVESVGYRWGDIAHAIERYSPESAKAGWNRLSDGEEFYFVSNPALGLWTARELSE